MKRFAILLVISSVAAAFQGRAPTEGPPLVLTHATVIDTTGGPPQQDMTVITAEGRVARVGKSGEVSVPPGAEIVDARGKFLIPGLWDMHVHLAQQAFENKWTRSVILPLLVANGITGVRDMGGNFQVIQSLRKEIAAHERLGPRIVAAGAAFDGPPSESSVDNLSIDTAAAGRQAVIAQKQRGVDFIKILTLVPRAAYFAIAEEAKKENLPFAGHVPEAVSVIEASEAGQKSMEHLTGVFLNCSSREQELRSAVLDGVRKSVPFVLERISNHLPPRGAVESYDSGKCAQVFRVLAKNGTWQTPTLVSQQAFSIIARRRTLDDPAMKYVPGELRESGEAVDFKKLQPRDVTDLAEYFVKSTPFVAAEHRAGVPFLAGTDAPYPPQAGFTLHQELALLAKAGLTPLEALQAATLNPAKFLGTTGSMGTVGAGKVADLVLLDANPLEDITNTTKIDAVIVAGRYLSRADLDAMLARVAAIAKLQ